MSVDNYSHFISLSRFLAHQFLLTSEANSSTSS
ncbi:hypothetical protein [uncultured Mucilaginibacter sp.]